MTFWVINHPIVAKRENDCPLEECALSIMYAVNKLAESDIHQSVNQSTSLVLLRENNLSILLDNELADRNATRTVHF